MESKDLDLVQVDALLDGYWPDMARDLAELIAIPSVEAAAAGPGQPFGATVAAALEQALTISRRLGLPTENIDGYLGLATLPGSTKERIGVLTHVDVVPADPGEWDTPPFAPVIREERIYGRGALDDKGPLIASLYAGVALREAGIQLHKTVSFMFGTNEESGCHCLEYYLEHHTPPEMGFSPDAEFPLIIGEKGICHFALAAAWDNEATEGLRLLSVDCGSAPNILPGIAKARLLGANAAPPAAAPGISVEQQGDELLVTATGKAAHGSMPEEGQNALVMLVNYLAALPLAPKGAADYLQALTRLLADDSYGAGMGLAAEDEASRLTLVPSILKIDAGQARLICDMRFPVTHKKETYIERLSRLAAAEHMELIIETAMDPLYAAEDDRVARLLLDAYRDLTGDMSEPRVIGGGTYAKELPGFLAFGPEFDHTPKLCHQANEYIAKQDMLDAAKIYARAIYLLAHE